MAPHTLFLARLLGIFCILVAVSILADKARFLRRAEGLLADEPLLFVVALATVALGLAMVLSHNVWGGGPLTIMVTLVGWLSLGKGVALLLMPREALARLYAKLDYRRYFWVLGLVALALGLFLALA